MGCQRSYHTPIRCQERSHTHRLIGVSQAPMGCQGGSHTPVACQGPAPPRPGPWSLAPMASGSQLLTPWRLNPGFWSLPRESRLLAPGPRLPAQSATLPLSYRLAAPRPRLPGGFPWTLKGASTTPKALRGPPTPPQTLTPVQSVTFAL